MVRTQIQLTQQQATLVKQAAAAANLSMADIVRRGLDLYLRTQATLTTEDRIQRARAAAGRFHSGMKDVSARHDAHLAEAFKP